MYTWLHYLSISFQKYRGTFHNMLWRGGTESIRGKWRSGFWFSYRESEGKSTNKLVLSLKKKPAPDQQISARPGSERAAVLSQGQPGAVSPHGQLTASPSPHARGMCFPTDSAPDVGRQGSQGHCALRASVSMGKLWMKDRWETRTPQNKALFPASFCFYGSDL